MNRRLLLFVILCLTVLAAACQRAPPEDIGNSQSAEPSVFCGCYALYPAH